MPFWEDCHTLLATTDTDGAMAALTTECLAAHAAEGGGSGAGGGAGAGGLGDSCRTYTGSCGPNLSCERPANSVGGCDVGTYPQQCVGNCVATKH